MHRLLDMLVFGGERRAEVTYSPSHWRRLFHILGGSSIPLAGIFFSETVIISVLAFLAGGGLALDLVRFQVGWLNSLFLRCLSPLLKEDEGAHITGATYMVVAALLAFVLYGREVAIPVMFFLSLGDPAAAIVGKCMPGPRFQNKSPFGAAAFIVVGAGASVVLVAANGIEHYWAIWVGVAVAGTVEFASIPPDDNLSIPLLAGCVMFVLGA